MHSVLCRHSLNFCRSFPIWVPVAYFLSFSKSFCTFHLFPHQDFLLTSFFRFLFVIICPITPPWKSRETYILRSQFPFGLSSLRKTHGWEKQFTVPSNTKVTSLWLPSTLESAYCLGCVGNQMISFPGHNALQIIWQHGWISLAEDYCKVSIQQVSRIGSVVPCIGVKGTDLFPTLNKSLKLPSPDFLEEYPSQVYLNQLTPILAFILRV